MLRKVNIAGLTLDEDSKAPILILKTTDTGEAIPIWIGLLEATAIASALQGIDFDRPMTHDLFKDFISLMKVDLTRIEVSDLENNTFFARIFFVAGEKELSLDARPSDAIALAVRFDCDIYVDEKVITALKPGGGAQVDTIEDKSEEGKKLAEYLKNLSPDDFGKYKV